jgi:hypothetical protein
MTFWTGDPSLFLGYVEKGPFHVDDRSMTIIPERHSGPEVLFMGMSSEKQVSLP